MCEIKDARSLKPYLLMPVANAINSVQRAARRWTTRSWQSALQRRTRTSSWSSTRPGDMLGWLYERVESNNTSPYYLTFIYLAAGLKERGLDGCAFFVILTVYVRGCRDRTLQVATSF